MNLQQVSTEEQFSKRIKQFLELCDRQQEHQVLIIQGQVSPQTPDGLIECIHYAILNISQCFLEQRFCILLVLQVRQINGGFFSGFPNSKWRALHIDELAGGQVGLTMSDWKNKSVCEVLRRDEHLRVDQIIEEALPKAMSITFADDDDESYSTLIRCTEILKEQFSNKNTVSTFSLHH
jgi:hypothetical protein